MMAANPFFSPLLHSTTRTSAAAALNQQSSLSTLADAGSRSPASVSHSPTYPEKAGNNAATGVASLMTSAANPQPLPNSLGLADCIAFFKKYYSSANESAGQENSETGETSAMQWTWPPGLLPATAQIVDTASLQNPVHKGAKKECEESGEERVEDGNGCGKGISETETKSPEPNGTEV